MKIIFISAVNKEFVCKININQDDCNMLRGGRPWNWESIVYKTTIDINSYLGAGIMEIRSEYIGDLIIDSHNNAR
jgi:hypothetical protein